MDVEDIVCRRVACPARRPSAFRDGTDTRICRSRLAGERVRPSTATVTGQPGSPASRLLQIEAGTEDAGDLRSRQARKMSRALRMRGECSGSEIDEAGRSGSGLAESRMPRRDRQGMDNLPNQNRRGPDSVRVWKPPGRINVRMSHRLRNPAGKKCPAHEQQRQDDEWP